MKKIIFLSIAVFYIQIFSYAQDTEQKAKDILSEISSQTSSYENMTFDFTLGIKSQDINEVQNGKAIISENNFYYQTSDREVISNGTSVWTYMKEDNECYIDDINGFDFVNYQANVIGDDDHGTHIAGICVAEKDNQIGISGVFPNAKFIPLACGSSLDSLDSFDSLESILLVQFFALDESIEVNSSSDDEQSVIGSITFLVISLSVGDSKSDIEISFDFSFLNFILDLFFFE